MPTNPALPAQVPGGSSSGAVVAASLVDFALVKPDLHPSVSADLYEMSELSDVEFEHFKSIRNEMRAAIRSLLK
ncbi:hypothetical protein PIB30_092838, partial [Stylosanthes scabra]|nr:hypothetical protein [Stylosanthes scabra]